MSVRTYRINVIPSEDNRYTVGRTETWVVKPDKSFDAIQEARNHIYQMTVIHIPYFTELTHGLTDEQRLNFLSEFCFDNDLYLKYRRFFIGTPPIVAIKNALKLEGRTVL